ncbi:hypothetical protein QQ056_12920 [Oscillatoria laete-virens NRMC-F 0139]|nr:hypothetical protein [Oscillatoria laete-virens NRMC-F 0139]
MWINGHKERLHRVHQWFAPARFGLFYHWGLFTGGGNSAKAEWGAPLHIPSIQALEQSSPPPAILARNLVATALKVRAKYITFTVVHSCGGWAVVYPTKVPGFHHVTSLDYVGALLDEAQKHRVRVMLYLPGGMGHWDSDGGPWVAENLRTPAGYAEGLKKMAHELIDLYGSKISGFWLDGLDNLLSDLPSIMHQRLPDCIVCVNNFTRFQVPEMDYSTTEFLSNTPAPSYNRPSGLTKPIDWIEGMLPPLRDLNEDIPTCNDWWHGAPPYNQPWLREYAYRQGFNNYQHDRHFWIKEMVCSLGIRGQWNYTMGIGPMLDGTIPPAFMPMIEAMAEFMSWASPAIHDTTGGDRSPLAPGFCNDGAFCAVTQSLKNPAICHILVTEPPQKEHIRVQTNLMKVLSVHDLRTNQPMRFSQNSALEITPPDWSSIQRDGVSVFRVEFAPHDRLS